MVRPICRDPMLLRCKSRPAVQADLPAARDLEDTLRSHAAECVGMAANMIGLPVRIIAVSVGPAVLTMLNPELVSSSGPYEAEEGCLSLSGVRKTRRMRTITVRWQDTGMKSRCQTFSGWTAQIIQHEMDHVEGILI